MQFESYWRPLPGGGPGDDRYGAARPSRRPAYPTALSSDYSSPRPRGDPYSSRPPQRPRPAPSTFSAPSGSSSRNYSTRAPEPQSRSNYPTSDSRSAYGTSSTRRAPQPRIYDSSDYQPSRSGRTKEPMPSRSRRREPSPDYESEVDEAEPQKPNAGADEGAWSWNNLKKTVWGDKENNVADSNQTTEEEEAAQPAEGEEPNTIWSKLAYVGQTLQKKINGDEGYASDATDYEGESHLTRIMKKYYVENAKSRRDLPDWLFTDAEIGAAGASLSEKSMNSRNNNKPEPRRNRRDHYEDDYEDEGYDARPKGLSVIFDSVNQDRNGRSSSTRNKQSFDSGYGSSTTNNSSRNNSKYGKYPGRDEGGEMDDRSRPVGRNRLASKQSTTRLRDQSQPRQRERGDGINRSRGGYEDDGYSRTNKYPRPSEESSRNMRPPASSSSRSRLPPPSNSSRAGYGYEEPQPGRRRMPIPQNDIPMRYQRR